jgi:hypothetical protein
MNRNIKYVLIISMLGFFVGCSQAGSEDTKASNDYFETAKAYINASTPFGSQTNVDDSLNIKIEFDPSLTTHSGSQNITNVGYLATVRKKLTMNADKTLIMIERIQASQKDGTTMSLTMRSGNNKRRTDDGLGGFFRQKGFTDTACDRIVFNATGQGVCLNMIGGSLQMSKLSTSFGNRIASGCSDTGTGISCGKRDKIVSVKTVTSGVVTDSVFRPQAP